MDAARFEKAAVPVEGGPFRVMNTFTSLVGSARANSLGPVGAVDKTPGGDGGRESEEDGADGGFHGFDLRRIDFGQAVVNWCMLRGSSQKRGMNWESYDGLQEVERGFPKVSVDEDPSSEEWIVMFRLELYCPYLYILL